MGNAGQPPACGKRGQPLGVGRRARQRPRARGRGSVDAQGADRPPPIPRLGLGPGGHARTPHACLNGTSRFQPDPSTGPARGWREPQARPEAVEKIVTGILVDGGPGLAGLTLIVTGFVP